MEEGKSVDGSREQDSLCGNEIEAKKETNSGTCTNTMDVDINSEPGPGRADKSDDSKNQADSASKIYKSHSESMKVFQDKCQKISTGIVGLDIQFLTVEFPSQSDIENYITRGHIDFPLTLPKGGNNQTFPEGMLKFRGINWFILFGWLECRFLFTEADGSNPGISMSCP